MTVSRIVTTEEFKRMISYKVYAENHGQQQSLKGVASGKCGFTTLRDFI